MLVNSSAGRKHLPFAAPKMTNSSTSRPIRLLLTLPARTFAFQRSKRQLLWALLFLQVTSWASTQVSPRVQSALLNGIRHSPPTQTTRLFTSSCMSSGRMFTRVSLSLQTRVRLRACGEHLAVSAGSPAAPRRRSVTHEMSPPQNTRYTAHVSAARHRREARKKNVWSH